MAVDLESPETGGVRVLALGVMIAMDMLCGKWKRIAWMVLAMWIVCVR